MSTKVIPPTVLFLSYDDAFATYGGIQTQLSEHLAGRLAAGAKTIVRFLPTLHSGQIKSIAGQHHFGLQTLEAELSTIVEKQGITILHSHNIHRPEGEGVAHVVEEVVRKYGLFHVTTIHDLIPKHLPGELLRQQSLLKDCVRTVTSDFNRRSLSNVMGLDATVVSPCLPSFTSHGGSFLEKRIPTIAAPGRLTPRKGLIEAVIIAGHISREIGPMRILLSSVRHPSNRAPAQFLIELKRIARCFPDLELAFFRGAAAFPDMYLGADVVLCLPTDVEGFGLIPLESVAAGVPVIAIPNGGLEWVKAYPSSIICYTKDYVAIAAQARDMLLAREEWRARVGSDQARISQTFSRDRMQQAYEDLYQKLTSAGAL